MTVGQTGKLLGVSEQKLDLEARLVIAVESQSVYVDVSAKEHSPPVVFGVNHEHHAEVTLKLHMIEDLMIEHDLVLFRLNFFKAREGVPVHLAVGCFRTPWPSALRSLVEIAEIGVEAQFANLLKPQGTDTPKELLFAVIAIGDDVA